MASRVKKGLSYVLGDDNDSENHILPINAMQYSTRYDKLYTGGRDGTVKEWIPTNNNNNSNNNTTRQLAEDAVSEEDDFNFDDRFTDAGSNYTTINNAPPKDSYHNLDFDQDVDEKVLKLETAISSNPVPCPAPQLQYSSRSTNNYNIYFDWINDLQLVNQDQHLVSCSSDLSLKLIHLPHSVTTSANNTTHNLSNSITSLRTNISTSDTQNGVVHRFPNIHTDYIKKLSHIAPANQIVSGGLDGKIVIWDLKSLKPINHFRNLSTNDSSRSSPAPSSIYSLANNDSNLISVGGPNSTINIYDKRASSSSGNNFIRKLIGHQDNIRCLLMNDTFILSGSSDSTIKLWDLRNFKVYKNFDLHDDAVWSLASPNNNFNVFYSGDKSGNIIKTDLSYLSNTVDKNLFPSSDTFSPTDTTLIDEKLGISTLVAKDDYPILSICVESPSSSSFSSASSTAKTSTGETSVFASTYRALNRYHVPGTDQLARYQYLRTCLDYTINDEFTNGRFGDAAADGVVATAAAVSESNNDLHSDIYDLVSHLSMDTSNFDLQSSFSGGMLAHNNNYGDHDADEVKFNTNPNNLEPDDNEYTSMFININGGGPSTEFVNTYKERLWNGQLGIMDADNEDSLSPPTSQSTNEFIDETPVEIALNPIPPHQIQLIPFNKTPINAFQLTPKSIISKKLFNNKRWMLVLYLNGDIKIWDIFICKEIKSFINNKQDSNCPMSKEMIESRLKEMEDIFQEYQTIDTLTNWCEVEIKSGKLMVTLKETSFNNVEIYYDELVSQYPYLDFNHSDNSASQKNKKVKVTEDDRFYLSRILLNSLFHSYELYESEFDKQLRHDLKKPKSKSTFLGFSAGGETGTANSEANSVAPSSNATEDNGGTSVPSTPAKRMRMFSRKSSRNNITLSQQAQTTAEIGSSQTNSPTLSAINPFDVAQSGNEDNDATDDHTGKSTISEIAGVAQEDSILKLLQFNKRRYIEKYNSGDKHSKVTNSLLKIYTNDPTLNENYKEEDTESHKPLIQPHRLPPNLLIIIFENSSELGNYRDVCSFHFDDLCKLNFENRHQNHSASLIRDLRNHLPKWIGQSILYDRFPVKENPKIAFQLLEVDYGQIPPDKKIGGKSQRKIKKLPMLESSIKLTSHNMLRVSKILSYLTEKFDSRTSEMKEQKPPTEWLAIECKGEELPSNMTLQTIKTKIWKSSSDIELNFRRKFDS